MRLSFLKKSDPVPFVSRHSVSERHFYKELPDCWWTGGGEHGFKAGGDTPDVPADHFSMPPSA